MNRKIKEFFTEPPRWEEYRDYFQLSVFRYLLLWFSIVPVLAGLMESLPNPLPMDAGRQLIYLNLTLPFNWQILWLSSFCFVCAMGLYYVFCPKFVRKYHYYSEYQSHAHDPRWMAWEVSKMWRVIGSTEKDKFLDRLLTKRYLEIIETKDFPENPVEPIVYERHTAFYISHEVKRYKFSAPLCLSTETPSEDVEKGVFYEVFGRYSASSYYARLAIRVLLVISLVTFLCPAFQHIFHGAEYVATWIHTYNHSI